MPLVSEMSDAWLAGGGASGTGACTGTLPGLGVTSLGNCTAGGSSRCGGPSAGLRPCMLGESCGEDLLALRILGEHPPVGTRASRDCMLGESVSVRRVTPGGPGVLGGRTALAVRLTGTRPSAPSPVGRTMDGLGLRMASAR